MKKNRIILLGASKRFDSIQLLLESAKNLKVQLDIISIESDASIPHPISELAEVVEGPEFSSPRLEKFILDVAQGEKTLVIPFMDSAAATTSKFSNTINVHWIVSPDSVVVSDKRSMKKIASQLGVDVVPNTPDTWPKIGKPALGFGSRGQQILNNLNELIEFEYTQIPYVIEDYCPGPESTVDVYFSRDRQPHSIIARDRLIVESGEVIRTKTRNPNKKELTAINAFSQLNLKGPVNFQFLSVNHNQYLMEINPRFSGGSTASIRAGWQAWDWIIQEYLLNNPITGVGFEHVEVTRSRRDHVSYYEK